MEWKLLIVGNMFKAFSVAFLLLLTVHANADESALAGEIMRHGKAYGDLQELVSIGPRMTGSQGAQKAILWARKKMISYGFDRVRLQPVLVPKWIRGNSESAVVTSLKTPLALQIAALGNSVGTSPGGVEAEIVEVHSLQEVQSLGDAVRGKIIFYNRPMDPSIEPFDAYDGAADQRYAGASQAAKFGAVAVLVRSLTTLTDDDHPHTGTLAYWKDAPQIPAAAISTHGATQLSALLKGKNPVKVKLLLSARMLEPVLSYNVIGELIGAEKPDEIIVVGAHLDSWDLSGGAHDDGAGVVQVIEVLRAMKKLNFRPKRTLRAVLFMNEESGTAGATEYAKQALQQKEKHIAAIESDQGGFAPRGFSFHGNDQAFARVERMRGELAKVHADKIIKGYTGDDVELLTEAGTVTFELLADSTHYFDYHHSALDTLEHVNARELKSGAASMAVLASLISEQGL